MRDMEILAQMRSVYNLCGNYTKVQASDQSALNRTRRISGFLDSCSEEIKE